MHYALLAYHVETAITVLTPQEDEALMSDLHGVHDRWAAEGRLGPAARLGATTDALTLRRDARGAPMVVDGPFAETKEQLLGFYVIEADSMEAALESAKALAAVNPSAVYEVRPIRLFLPGVLGSGRGH